MKYKMQVTCEECAKFELMKGKPRRRRCTYDGTKISVAQSKKLIDCDFFEDIKLLDPAKAGWRAYITPYFCGAVASGQI